MSVLAEGSHCRASFYADEDAALSSRERTSEGSTGPSDISQRMLVW
jgi:hypothetical protein